MPKLEDVKSYLPTNREWMSPKVMSHECSHECSWIMKLNGVIFANLLCEVTVANWVQIMWIKFSSARLQSGIFYAWQWQSSDEARRAAKRSREPDLNQWPKDIKHRQLQSSALPTELSRAICSQPKSPKISKNFFLVTMTTWQKVLITPAYKWKVDLWTITFLWSKAVIIRLHLLRDKFKATLDYPASLMR